MNIGDIFTDGGLKYKVIGEINGMPISTMIKDEEVVEETVEVEKPKRGRKSGKAE